MIDAEPRQVTLANDIASNQEDSDLTRQEELKHAEYDGIRNRLEPGEVDPRADDDVPSHPVDEEARPRPMPAAAPAHGPVLSAHGPGQQLSAHSPDADDTGEASDSNSIAAGRDAHNGSVVDAVSLLTELEPKPQQHAIYQLQAISTSPSSAQGDVDSTSAEGLVRDTQMIDTGEIGEDAVVTDRCCSKFGSGIISEEEWKKVGRRSPANSTGTGGSAESEPARSTGTDGSAESARTTGTGHSAEPARITGTDHDVDSRSDSEDRSRQTTIADKQAEKEAGTEVYWSPLPKTATDNNAAAKRKIALTRTQEEEVYASASSACGANPDKKQKRGGVVRLQTEPRQSTPNASRTRKKVWPTRLLPFQ